ncbi:InlB B-repeat-containing protein, partial [Anaerotignum sp.]
MKLKKMLAALLTLAMVTTALPVSALAATEVNTMQGLVDALNANATEINVTENIVITGDSVLEIGLNGETIQFDSGKGFIVASGGKLVIEGSGTITEVADGEEGNLAPIRVYGGGTVEATDVTLEGWAGIMVRQEGKDGMNSCGNDKITVELRDATLKGVKDGDSTANGLYVNGGVDGENNTITLTNTTIISDSDGIYQAGNVNTTITSSSVTGNRDGIVVAAGTMKINNGTEVTAKGEGSASNIGGGVDTGEKVGNALIVTQHSEDHDTEVTVGDGVFDGAIDVKSEATLTVKEGSFTDLANAVKYAGSDATIKLLKDTEGSGVVIDKDITIDFGGNTYTITDNAVGSTGTKTLGFQILEDNDVVLKNGEITEKTDETAEQPHAVKMLINNYSNLKLDDIVLDGSGLGEGRYTLSNNCGDITITGKTDIIASKNGVAFDVYKDASYKAPEVTVDDDFTGKVEGKIEVSDEAKLTIYAGTFTVALEGAWCASGLAPVDNGDGTWTVGVSEDAVAEVKGTYYEDLKEAMEACTNGETVKLIKDITYDADDVVYAHGGATGFGKYDASNPSIIYIGGTKGATPSENRPSDVNAVIDLNGHSITNNADAYLFLIMDNAKVTFKDSKGDGSVTNTENMPVIWVTGTDTTVTIESGEYVTANDEGLLWSTHAGDLVINGGTFKTTDDNASLLVVRNTKVFNNPNYFLEGTATIKVTGGDFVGFNPEETFDDNTKPFTKFNAVEEGYVSTLLKDDETYRVHEEGTEAEPSTPSKNKTKKYDVIIKSSDNGDVEVDDDYAKRGQEITITVDPDKGYELDELTITDQNGDEVDYDEGKKENTFVFDMPKSDVTIEASFDKASSSVDDKEDVDKEDVSDKEDEDTSKDDEQKYIRLTIGQKIVWLFDEYVVNDVAPEIK